MRYLYNSTSHFESCIIIATIMVMKNVNYDDVFLSYRFQFGSVMKN